jgi:LRR receptor-like serine/threonine-protein kinase FLS2
VDAYDKRDLDALLSFRNAITRDPYGLLSNWTAENSEKMCSWYGIRCILHTTRVVSIDLAFDESSLEGTLSPSLGNLSLLHTLKLSFNDLPGRIPPELGQLKALRTLGLGDNSLNSSIPFALG